MKNPFPQDNNEQELVKFIGRYQYLKEEDSKYFFESDFYYKKRIRRLVQNEIIRRYKDYLVIAPNGIKYLKASNSICKHINYGQKYIKRLHYLSHLGAMFNSSRNVKFIPSFELKDEKVFTETSRRYIGILVIRGIKYLLYYIPNGSTNKYINSIKYDIEKETNIENIIILTYDIKAINFSDFFFGKNSVLLVEDNESNITSLEYLYNINWSKIIENLYGNKVFLSEYNYCDYTNAKDLFINCFYFLDLEKLNRINHFLQNNYDKRVNIVCNRDVYKLIASIFHKARFNVVDLEKYIDKEITYYD